MTLAGPRVIRLLLGFAIVAASLGSQPAAASTGSSGSTRMISASGSAGMTAGSPDSVAGVESFETPSTGGGGANVNRSSSFGSSSPVGATSQPKNVTTSAPDVLTSFDGINHLQQRFGTKNQFSLEPPDQGLCVGSDGAGHTRVLEVVNDTLRVYTTDGAALTGPVALNAFYGYPPAIIRATPTVPAKFGPFVDTHRTSEVRTIRHGPVLHLRRPHRPVVHRGPDPGHRLARRGLHRHQPPRPGREQLVQPA